MGSSHFDDSASDWDSDPAKVTRAQVTADAIAAAVPVRADSRVLEYGAGTGLVTQALGERVGEAVLADNSAGMRRVMLDKIAAGTLPNAQVWDLDLEHRAPPEERFDLVLTALVLHHVHELDLVLSRFAELLLPGGHVAIADLDPASDPAHQHDFDVHHGFDRAELTERLTRAGFVDVRLEDCGGLVREGVPYTVFLAVARRP